MKISKLIDHTNLKPDATKEDIQRLCSEAIEYDFATVCVNQSNTKFASELLYNSQVGVCTVVGFPLGATSTDVKVFETNRALEDGATEIDMVINIGALKDKRYDYVEKEIKAIKQACGEKTLKVIIETCLLSNDEIVKVCDLAVSAKADFVKTSTGFSKGGATVEAVSLMKRTVNQGALVKASGGIKDFETTQKMIDAGASRIGTSSGIEIIK